MLTVRMHSVGSELEILAFVFELHLTLVQDQAPSEKSFKYYWQRIYPTLCVIFFSIST